jgi:hypothetical protein
VWSDGQEARRFTLLVGPEIRSDEGIDWSVLPADRLTGWLSPSPRHKTMVIDPLAGCPD